MRHGIEFGPSYAQLTVELEPNEQVRAEAGAMVSYAGDVEVETNATGGFLTSLKRSVLGGESFFQNAFVAGGDGGTVSFAPPLPGDVVHTELDGQTVYVQSGSYLASDPELTVDAEFGGARTFFGSEGLFLLEVSGSGPLFLSSYGAIQRASLEEAAPLVVDTGHVVAFDSTADFTVRRVGGLKSTLFSGEGLVCAFRGSGDVWLQTRSAGSLLAWLVPKLPRSNPGTASTGQ